MEEKKDSALGFYDWWAEPAMYLGHLVALVVFCIQQAIPSLENWSWQSYSAKKLLQDTGFTISESPNLITQFLNFINGPIFILILTFLFITFILPVLSKSYAYIKNK